MTIPEVKKYLAEKTGAKIRVKKLDSRRLGHALTNQDNFEYEILVPRDHGSYLAFIDKNHRLRLVLVAEKTVTKERLEVLLTDINNEKKGEAA